MQSLRPKVSFYFLELIKRLNLGQFNKKNLKKN